MQRRLITMYIVLHVRREPRICIKHLRDNLGTKLNNKLKHKKIHKQEALSLYAVLYETPEDREY